MARYVLLFGFLTVALGLISVLLGMALHWPAEQRLSEVRLHEQLLQDAVRDLSMEREFWKTRAQILERVLVRETMTCEPRTGL